MRPSEARKLQIKQGVAGCGQLCPSSGAGAVFGRVVEKGWIEMNAAQKSTEQEKSEREQKLEEQLAEKARIIQEQQAQIERLEAQNRYLSESLDTISNSFFWKITKPIRVVLDYTKLFFRKTR